jgi:hypothetical protein
MWIGPSLIDIPTIAARQGELARTIQEYAADAATALGVSRALFTDDDCQWVAEHAAHTLPEIDAATQRLTAFRATGQISKAAGLLGMAAVSLTRWLERRAPLPPVGPSGTDETS